LSIFRPSTAGVGISDHFTIKAYESGACAYILKRPQFEEMMQVLANIFNVWLDANISVQ
jgi:hypothetical protein